MFTTTINGYSTVPLRLPLLLGIYQRNVNHPEMNNGNNTSCSKVKFAMVRFLHFRQKSKMALLLNLMSLLLFASSFWVSQAEYIIGLGLICFSGFLILFALAFTDKEACYELLDKSPRLRAKYLVALCDAMVYTWAYFRQDRQMRALITGLFNESGFIRFR
jgi:hypothetical protein